MIRVLFVAPFFAETTMRFASAVCAVDGIRVGLISQEPIERLPADIRQRLAAYERIPDGLDADQIADAARRLGAEIGGRDRLLGVLEQLQVPLAEVRERLGIPGMGVAEAHNFRDKARMKDVLRRSGVPCARHALAQSKDAILPAARQVGFPLVAKPPTGAGAKSTFRVESEEQLEEILPYLTCTPDSPVLLEEFIVGEEHSFDSVVIEGQPIWHSLTRYLPGPLEVLENPWMQWCVLLPREIEDPQYDLIREGALSSLRALGLHTGFSHLEWFRRRDGSLAISEVGARPPGAHITSLICQAHDTDFYRAWARLMIFHEFEAPTRPYAAGAAYLRGQGRGRVSLIEGIDVVQRELGHLIVESRLPRIGQPQASGYEGEGYVIIRHPDTDVVERALLRIVSSIRIHLS